MGAFINRPKVFTSYSAQLSSLHLTKSFPLFAALPWPDFGHSTVSLEFHIIGWFLLILLTFMSWNTPGLRHQIFLLFAYTHYLGNLIQSCGSKYYVHMDDSSYVCTFRTNLYLELETNIYNYLLNIFTWISKSYLKVKASKLERRRKTVIIWRWHDDIT